MSNGAVVIICLIAVTLFLMTAAIVAVIVLLRKHLPAVKSFFLNLANGIERNQVQIDELKSALTKYHAGLDAAVSSSEQKIMNQLQELRTRLDEESAAREKAISTTRTAIVEAVGKTKMEIAANAKENRTALLARLDEESVAREKAVSAARTAIVEAVGKTKTEIAANAKENRTALLARLDEESAAREKTVSAARTAIVEAVGKTKTEIAANAKENRTALMEKIDTVQEGISARLDQLDYIFDQCKTVGEILSRVETHLKAKLSKLGETQTQLRTFSEDVFRHWQEAVESQKSALDSLKNDLANLKDQEARHIKDNRLLLSEIQCKLEARLYGIQSSVLLLNSSVDAASPQETNAKKKTVSRKETKRENQRADFIPLPGEKTDFETLPDGKTTSRTYRDGKLIFEITLDEYGVPEKGTMFSESGKTIRKFDYGPDGQVK
ncbi:MAG: hypothetical protein J5806_08615 [Lentisphaeria bacterium]|nr:hypothetical protein [Lentisphaeria bacterium]